jgi:two-component system, LytTR family, response regulator
MYKSIIIDDEEMAQTLLKGMLAEYCPKVEVEAVCGDLLSGVEAIKNLKPDLVFLDIEMPGQSGLNLLDYFDEIEITFSIIFITAYNNYAISAFKLSAIDYLLKPIEVEDLTQAIALFEKNKNRNQFKFLKHNMGAATQKKIGLNTVGSIVYVVLDNILYFEADGSYCKVMLVDGKQITASKVLKHFEYVLSDNLNFFRCHKSYMININHIDEFVRADGGYLKLGGHQINISTDKVKNLLQLMEQI